jgi:protein TonB
MKVRALALSFVAIAALVTVAYAQDLGTVPAPPSPLAPHPARIRVPDKIAVAKLVHMVQPEYPADIKIEGTVIALHAIISRDGSVQSLQYVSGSPMLMRSALNAVSQWRYSPVKLNGQPVEVDTMINVVFELDKSGHLKPQPNTPKEPKAN